MSFRVFLLFLFRLSGAIIRFGDRSHFCSCGVLSRNLALYANSMIAADDRETGRTDEVLSEGFAASRVPIIPDTASLHKNMKNSHRRFWEVPVTLQSRGPKGEVSGRWCLRKRWYYTRNILYYDAPQS